MNLIITITKDDGQIMGEHSMNDVRAMYLSDKEKFDDQDILDGLIQEIKEQLEKCFELYD